MWAATDTAAYEIMFVELESNLLCIMILYNSEWLLSKKFVLFAFNKSRLKMMKNAFYFVLKTLLFSRCLNFCLDFSVIQKKRLYWKDKVNFNIFDFTTWLTSTYNTHSPISREVRTTKQWLGLVNITREIFFFKNYAQNDIGKLVPSLLLFY